MEEKIERVLKKLNEKNSYTKNYKIMFREFNYLGETDLDNRNLLHILTDSKFEENKCLIAIKILLKVGLNPNNVEKDGKYNFIQNALYSGYSEQFVINILKEAFKYGLNPNIQDDDKDTILHTAIYADDYTGGILSIYKLLTKHGFDSTLKDNDGYTVYDAIISENKHTHYAISEFKEIYLKQLNNNTSLEQKK